VPGAYIIMTVLALIIAALLFTIFRLQKGGFNQLAAKMADHDREKLQVLKPCPVCGTLLHKGETVHSIYYRQKTDGNHQLPVEEIMTHIFGCPHCWPANDENPRHCPVCRQTVSHDGYLVARTFRKPGRKDHVHVIGCTECKRVR
jgi:hypothetical protein